MAGDPPPGDGRGRGTPPPGDDPHRGRGFRPGPEGQARSGENHHQHPNDDSASGGRTRRTPGSWEGKPSDGQGQASPGQGSASNRPTEKDGWRNSWTVNAKKGFEALAQKVKEKLTFSGGQQKVDSSGEVDSSRDLQKALIQELPRLELYIQTVQGASLDPEQEAALLVLLDHALKQVQTLVKMLDEEPFEVDDVKSVPEIPSSIYQRPRAPTSYREALSGLVSGLSRHSAPPVPGFRKAVVLPSEQDSQTLKKEDHNDKLIMALHNFFGVAKRSIAVFQQSSQISPKLAEKLNLIVDCADLNFELVLRSQGHCFSIPGLVAKLVLPANIGTVHEEIEFITSVLRRIVTIADCIVDNIGTSPAQFNNIGQEARCILTEDFCFKKLKINSGPSKTACVVFGAEKVGEETAQQIMMKVKGHNMSLAFLVKSLGAQMAVANPAVNQNAAAHVEKDIVSAKLSVGKICGMNLKSVIECPFPSLNSKFEIQGSHPYVVYGGGIWLHRSYAGNARNAELRRFPTLSFSGLLGVKCVGIGGQVTFDSEKGHLSGSLGVDIRTKLCAIGITLNQVGTCRASVCKKLIDSSTTLAAKASYSRECGDEKGLKFTVGLKQAFDPELYVKARAGTDGLGMAVKKSWFDGKCTLKAGAHFDLKKEWRQPKLGLVLSLRS